jgi:hypothetical protein
MKTEAKDPREYGFEGEMAMSQLKGIMQHAESLHGMLKPDTDLPEWVQSKITLAYDYIQTAADYMSSEMNEESMLDEISAGLAYDYLKKSRKEFAKANSQYTKYRNIGKAATRPETKAKNAKLAKTYGDVADKRRKGSDLAFAKLNPERTPQDSSAKVLATDDLLKMNEEVNIDAYADSLIKRDKQNLRKDHVVHAARVAGVDHKKLLAAVQQKVGRLKEEAPTNAAGGGSIDGIGVGARGEPGVRKTKYQKKNAAEAPKSPVMDGMVRRKMPSFKQFMG